MKEPSPSRPWLSFGFESLGIGSLMPLFLIAQLSFGQRLIAQPSLVAVEPTVGNTAEPELMSIVASVRKPDPRSGDLVAVEPGEIKPGKIYNHFSPHHGRYVWAYANDRGGFSYALGIGSSEMPGNFDVVTSQRQTKELLEAQAGPWAKQSRLEGKQILVRLGADEKWQIVRGRTIRSHFDINSSRRWEWHGSRRVAVLHTYGDLWTFNGSRYIPAHPWHLSAIQ